MAGYPGNPLPKKLGIKAGHKVCLLNAPGAFARTITSEDVRITRDLRYPLVDMVVMFVDSLEELERRLSDVVGRLHPAGGFWVAWRRTSRRVSEDVVRRIALAVGMSANKACTFGGSYAGIRLVLRSEIRAAIAYRAEPPPSLSRRTRRPTTRIAPRIARSSSSGAGSTLRRARARSTK